MPRIKIISNPYKKEIRFQKWNEEVSDWSEITLDTNPSSNLLKRDIANGFFPFIIKKIVDCITTEYRSELEKFELIFEGSTDEYKELVAICSDEEYFDKVFVQQSEICLENARDILPAVKKLFQEMSPLIQQSAREEKIQRDLSRFTDASSDVVPICVLGNYSAGKSTFINALIGNEILPSGTEPVTAKVYKIARSKFTDRASIVFRYLNMNIQVAFTTNGTIVVGDSIANELVNTLRSAIAEVENENIVSRVNTVLKVINDFESEVEVPEISDLIEVEIPFENGVLANSQHPFVIFDTPGSNSATNARHLRVLKEAMVNMTNGLPIFLSTPESLDSMDNENLYHVIREMEELDNRFTMIVVNKADSAGIQRRGSTEEEQKRILNQSVPRNLYSCGLFYISSIMGLGSKTDGNFMDYVYEDIFDAQEERYTNPENKHYRTLYLFNIQPKQLKGKSDSEAASQTNLGYSNSGLYTIESEIEMFAGNYSAYNKCFQSQMFLSNVIEITKNEISETIKSREEIRQNIKDKLENDKKILINKIDNEVAQRKEGYVENYDDWISALLIGSNQTFSTTDLKKQEALFIKEQEELLGYQERTNVAKHARSSMASNFKDNIKDAFKEKNVNALKDVFGDLQSDVDSVVNSLQDQRSTRHKAHKQASSSLLNYVIEQFEKKLLDTYNDLDLKSKEYWSDKTEELRNILANIVAGSDVLTDDRRKELEKIIITYSAITFNEKQVDNIFDKEKFERRLKIGNQVLWELDYLNIDKLTKTYNSNYTDGVKERHLLIKQSHQKSASDWIQNLLDEIYENIVEYSPELSKQAEHIREMTKEIEKYEANQEKLQDYTEQLIMMMDWKMKQMGGF